MRIQIAVPEKHVSKPVLDAALEAVTRLNEQMIRAGDAPTSLQLLEQGARWKPEPPGQEHFDHAARIETRGDGDCDDWAPAHAATLRVTGRDPNAVAEVRKTGPKRWHATVYRSDGREDDPSLKAGMPGPGNPGVIGAWLPSMGGRVHGVSGAFLDMPRLAMRAIPNPDGDPTIESWQARADLPWHWRPDPNTRNPQDIAMVTLHRSPVSSTAICGAARGAFKLGLANGIDPEQLKRLSAICDMCEGAPWEDVAAMYGPEHATAAGAIVGSFFGKAFKSLGKVAKGVAKGALKVASPALSLVPGGGLASAALSMASPSLKKSVAKQKHAPPELRRPEGMIAPSAPVLQQAPQFLPYPYPLPYPVPGWSGATDSGVAWPPR